MAPLKLLLAASLAVVSFAEAQSLEPRPSLIRSGEVPSSRGTIGQSSFHAVVRGDVSGTAWGEAEFGAVQNPDRSPGAFVVSLGVCGDQSAILFTRRTGAALDVGRYRISAGADDENEVLALVLTGSPTHPTGVFSGHAGWLVVTAASARLTAGQFHIDAVGF